MEFADYQDAASPIIRSELCSSGPSVDTGLEVTRGKVSTDGAGSAGLIVRRAGDAANAYLLTCAHVLGSKHPGTDQAAINDNVVYSPHLKTCCDIECNNPFGMVVDDTLDNEPTDEEPLTREPLMHSLQAIGAEKFAVDAALVRLNPNARARNRVPKVGPMLAPRDLIGEWALNAAAVTDLRLPAAKQLKVKKYGRTTELTEGTIKRLVRMPVRLPGSPMTSLERALAFQVDADLAAHKPYTKEFVPDLDRYRIGTPGLTIDQLAQRFRDHLTALGTRFQADPRVQIVVNNLRTIKITSHTFAQKGDSGSPVLDQANQVIGIVQSVPYLRCLVKDGEDFSAPTGITTVIFVRAALEKLNATFLDGGQHAAGARIVVPGMAIDRHEPEPVNWNLLARNTALLEATPAGARIGLLARRHFEEIRALVHHRRRVTVTWHRSRGPAWLVTVLRALQDTDHEIPQVIDGASLIDAFHAMRNVLLAEGSESLRADLLEDESDLLEAAVTLAKGIAFRPVLEEAACTA